MKGDAGSSGLTRRDTGTARSMKMGPIKHAAAVPGLPVVLPRASWRPILGLVVSTLREWRRRHAGRRELASLNERMLRDLCLDPGVVNHEVRQPFWRPPRDWRV
jgi:uncharacterized protein YjiS (DUF1127 family)